MKLPSKELPVSALLASGMCGPSWFLAVTLSILLICPASHALGDDWNTHAPAAYCECNEPDAFPGVSNKFTRDELQQIKKAFEETDPRKPIDRMEARFKPLNAIGQTYSNLGFGTGVLVGDDLVLTNAHVVGAIGKKITFNVGQTPEGSRARWAYSTQGEVIDMGKNPEDSQQDWALIRIKKPLGKIVGSLDPAAMDENEMVYSSDHQQLITAGFPGFKDPRYLWGQRGIEIDYMNDKTLTNSASSSGMSGGAVVWEYAQGNFKLVGLVQGQRISGTKGSTVVKIDNHVNYTNSDGTIVNFKSKSFGKDFGPAYNKALGND
jgi:V8-like Glu-specific endopeptidase